jgi:hypothetical protein
MIKTVFLDPGTPKSKNNQKKAPSFSKSFAKEFFDFMILIDILRNYFMNFINKSINFAKILEVYFQILIYLEINNEVYM